MRRKIHATRYPDSRMRKTPDGGWSGWWVCNRKRWGGTSRKYADCERCLWLMRHGGETLALEARDL